ncbi:Unknown protein [Striga hermonthica]|uniref:F-box associated beta-propeller type 3 domain-containing protein n=1 Tax=Striga hermonthica TaxID=68872 RepID=A0A9N7NQH8_STRHE|nr:Unknown protein [Striga hermonthica]
MASSLNLNPYPSLFKPSKSLPAGRKNNPSLFKPSSFPVGRKNNPLLKPSSFPNIGMNKKNKSNYGKYPDDVDMEEDFWTKEALWNPTTNELKILPPSPATLDPRHELCVCNYFGFGYDSTSGDYKVIRFLRRSNDWTSLVAAELYSLKTNSWKRVNFRPYSFQWYGEPFAGVHVNGTYYWLNKLNDDFIQSFNFATEKFESDGVPTPPSEKLEKFCDKMLVEYRGSLGFLASTTVWVDDEMHNGLELWVWDDTSLSWAQESTFLVDKMSNYEGLFENDKLFYLQPGGDLMVHDCAMNTETNISNVCTHEFCSVFPFVENYVSLSSSGK